MYVMIHEPSLSDKSHKRIQNPLIFLIYTMVTLYNLMIKTMKGYMYTTVDRVEGKIYVFKKKEKIFFFCCFNITSEQNEQDQ